MRHARFVTIARHRIAVRNVSLACILAAAIFTRAFAEPPNIILLMGDDHGWDETAYNGHPHLRTPVLDEMARILKPGAELRIATDDPGYLDWILQRMVGHGGFDWLARRPVDWRDKPDDWPDSRYEAKARQAGRSCAYLRYVTRSNGN